MKILFLYFAVLFFIALKDFFKVKNFDDFIVAGKKQRLSFVTFSLLATVLGASATLGVCERAETEGFSAFWWLGFGSLGLFLQALFLSKKIRSFSVNTLPELVRFTVGPVGAKLVALVIAVSWVGVIAAQFVGLGYFLNLLVDDASKIMVIISALLVILYTLLGGQLSVVKTDVLQFSLFAIGIIGTFVFLFLADLPLGKTQEQMPAIEMFGTYSVLEWSVLGVTILGAFLLGPDIVSRNLLSDSPKVAKRANVLSGIFLIVFAFFITWIGVWCGIFFEGDKNPLLRLAEDFLPLPLAICLCVGMVSALFSSADTSLINVSSIFAQDLLGTKKIITVRLIVVLIGVLATLLALYGKDIITLLLSAYSVYTPGVVFPLAVAILAHGKFQVVEKIWVTGIVVGGILGLVGTFIAKEMNVFPLIGIALSLLFSLCSLRRIKNPT